MTPRTLAALLLACTALATPARAQSIPANAAPSGGRVVAGSAGIGQTATTTTVTQSSNRAVLEWQQFNVGSNQTVQFVQPSAQAWALNRVTGGDPSVIAGRMTANGGIALVNQSGLVFAAGSQVDVGSLIASASNITNANFMAGTLAFTEPPRPGARVSNAGGISVAAGGLAALVGPEVANSGSIRARLGRVALVGAETFTLDLAGDGLLSIDVTRQVRQAPSGGAALVTNSGSIEAPGGSVLLSASAASGLLETLIANTGSISAPSVAGRTGQVALRAEGGGTLVGGTLSATGGDGLRGGTLEANATGTVTLSSGARLDASGAAGGGRIAVGLAAASQPGAPRALARRSVVQAGAVLRADATSRGDGGSVVVHSAEATTDAGSASARGGPQGGNGGMVEISSRGSFMVNGQYSVAAPAGRAGTLLFDPTDVDIVTTVTGPNQLAASSLNAGGTVQATDSITVSAAVNASAVTGIADLTLQTTGLTGGVITVNQPISVINGSLLLQTQSSSGGSIAVYAPMTVTNGSITLASFGGGTLGGPGGSIALAANLTNTGSTGVFIIAGSGGTVTQAAGTSISTDALLSIGGGGLTLAGTLSTSGPISLDSFGATTDAGANFGAMVLNATLVGNSVGLNAAGTLTQGSGGITANILTLNAGSASLGGSNAVALLDDIGVSGSLALTNNVALQLSGSITAGGKISIANAGPLSLLAGLSISADSLELTGRGITVDSAQLLLGQAGLLSSRGAISIRDTSLSGLGTDLPALVLDSRAAGLTALPGFVQPDTATTQPTQLAQFGSTPTAASASAISLELAAGSSPVFLLTGAGAVTGTLQAGRVGLLGTGGSARLTGQLAGQADSSAATLALTRIYTDDPALQRYLFNGGVFQGIPRPRVVPPLLNPAIDTTTSGTGTPTSVANLYGSQAGLGPYDATDRLAAAETEATDPSGNAFTRRSAEPLPVTVVQAEQGRTADPELELPNAGSRDF